MFGQKTALICGAGGFIGSHLAKRLKSEGYWVRGVDLKYPEFCPTACDEFVIGDLRDPLVCQQAVTLSQEHAHFDEVYQLAADMGGMGYISCHDAEIMHNSALINLTMLEACRIAQAKKIFYSSSACVYPEYNQLDPQSPVCTESSAYPAAPDTEYGWEKLFSERLYRSYARDYGMAVRIARFHNVFGPEGTWTGGKEKAPAALCRKVADAHDGDTISVWGKGDQTRSFLYIDECIEGIRRLMDSDVEDIVNIGSHEMISINDLVHLIAKIAGKKVTVVNVEGPEGVRGRNSDNTLIKSKLGWAPSATLEAGLQQTYPWIMEQVYKKRDPVTHIQFPHDGFGFQFLWIINAVFAAEENNTRYLYTPFKAMEHNYDGDPDFLQKKEWLINFIDNFELNTPGNGSSVKMGIAGMSPECITRLAASQALGKIKKVFRLNKNTDHYFEGENLHIAVHVRRPNSHDNNPDGPDTPDNVFINAIAQLREIYAPKNPLFHIYSQGDKENFKKYEAPDTVFHLNESVEDSFTAMVFADVLVVSRSTFSYTAALLSDGVIYHIPRPLYNPAPHWIAL